jgi:hypothetical protein
MPFNLSPVAAVAMLAFVAFSIVVGGAMAGSGGWRSLAERYPARVPGPGDEERYRFSSLRTSGGLLGTARYDGCVTVGIGADGMSLALWAPFRLFHPPLFIPWEAVEACRIIPWLRGDLVQLTVGGGGTLTFADGTAKAIARRAEERGLPLTG